MQVVIVVAVFVALTVNTAILAAAAIMALLWSLPGPDEGDPALIARIGALDETDPPAGWEERLLARWRERFERTGGRVIQNNAAQSPTRGPCDHIMGEPGAPRRCGRMAPLHTDGGYYCDKHAWCSLGVPSPARQS